MPQPRKRNLPEAQKAAHNARQRRYRAEARPPGAGRYFRGKRTMSEAAKKKISAGGKAAWAAWKAGTGPKMGRTRTMSRKAAANLRYAKKTAATVRTTKRPAIERDALNAGASIMNEYQMRRPTFIVITPKGRRIETLEPDIA